MNRTVLSCIFFTCVFVFSLIFLSGCSDQDDSGKAGEEILKTRPVHGGIYRVPLRSNPVTLDPALVQDKYGEAVVHQVFEGLVRFDSFLTILPALAETWQVKEGGKVYRFILRKNAKFHNQEPVRSSDVIFSIKRLLRTDPAPAVLPHLLKIDGAEEYRKKSSEHIPGLEIETDTVFNIHLLESHVPFLTALGMYQAAIVPEKEVRERGEDFGKHPVGSGPFRFVSWEDEKEICLTRFDDYYAGPALLGGIYYKIYPGGQDPMIFEDFKNRQLEEMPVYGDVKKKLADISGLQWVHRPSLSLFFYGMNTRHPHLADPDLRKALSAAIDRTAFVNTIYNGQFDAAKTILPPGMPGYNPENRMKDTGADHSQTPLSLPAAQMDDLSSELEIVSAIKTPRVEQEMDMIKGFWDKLGLHVREKYITDWKKFEDYLRSDNVQIYRYAWFADMPDPDSFLYSLFASESPNNFMKFQNNNIDRMLLTARGIVDPVDRAKMYQKIETMIMDNAPLIPLFYMSVDRVYQSYVKSVSVNALGAHTMQLNHIWLDNSPQND